MIDKFQGEYRWLSNFELVNVIYENVIFSSTEAAYQAAKSLDKADHFRFAKMTPAESKAEGRKLTLRPDWEEVKYGIMLDLNRQKYKRLDLRNKLLATGDQELVEGNTWNDTYWGVCNGVGENNLGKILMQIRKELNGN